MNNGSPTLAAKESHDYEGPIALTYDPVPGAQVKINPSGDFYDFWTNTEPVKCPLTYQCSISVKNTQISYYNQERIKYYGVEFS